MRTYNYSEVADDLSLVLDSALSEEVIVKNKDGINFRISPINEINGGKSPLEGIKGIKAKVTTQELVEIIREGRAGN
jgi:hypothetical protein